MLIKDIIQSLEELAPPVYQENYDNARLICGDPYAKASGVLCSLDCVESIVDEAIKNKCNVIVAHHPIVFKGLTSLTGKTHVERTVIKAIKNDIAIYAIHTNLDNMRNGVNDEIGKRLGLINNRILLPKKSLLKKIYTFIPEANASEVRTAMYQAGAGVISEYDHCSFNTVGTGTFRGSEDSNPTVGERGADHQEKELKVEMIFEAHLENRILGALLEAHPYEEVAYDIITLDNAHQRIGSGMIGETEAAYSEADFLNHVSKCFGTSVIKHTPLLNKPIKKVAYCGGAGSFLLNHAIANSADVFITGDFKYHEFFSAEEKIVVMDIGHFESEQFTPHLIKRYLEQKFPTFAVLLSEVNTNPVQYFIS